MQCQCLESTSSCDGLKRVRTGVIFHNILQHGYYANDGKVDLNSTPTAVTLWAIKSLTCLKTTQIQTKNGLDPNSVTSQLPPYSPPRTNSAPFKAANGISKPREQPQAVGDFGWGPWTVQGEVSELLFVIR